MSSFTSKSSSSFATKSSNTFSTQFSSSSGSSFALAMTALSSASVPVFKSPNESSINYEHSHSALFLTTPKLLSSLSSSFSSNDIIFNNLTSSRVQNKNTPWLNIDADEIYGTKVLRMSESVFGTLFRHAEKVRIQNQVQAKMLHEKLNGHNGIERKLQ